MSDITFTLNQEYIALCDLLKLTGLADSGGQGKIMVAAGDVMVDGAVELRKTAKIRHGQTIRCGDVTIAVRQSDNHGSAS